MKPLNDAERRKAKTKFILLFAGTAVLIMIICSAFWGPLPTQPAQQNENKQQVATLQKDNKIKEATIAYLQQQLDSQLLKKSPAASTDQQIAALQKNVQAKDAKITELQNQLTADKANTTTTNAQQNLNASQKDLQAKDAKIESLQRQLNAYNSSNGADIPSSNLTIAEENKFLKWALRSQIAISDNLTKQLNQLKKK